MTPKIIGLAGAAGSGKDTVAAILQDNFGYWTYAFARPLKDALASLGIAEPANREDKECTLVGRAYSYRTAAQTLGTEWARALDTNFWLNLAKANVQGRPLVVVSDVRFDNEAEWIRTSGGSVWHLEGRYAQLNGYTKTHKSESPLPRLPNDAVLDNSGAIDLLKQQVISLISYKGE